MTPSATRFVGELTFAALTRHPVETDVGGPAARPADRPHRHRRQRRCDRRRPGDRPLAGGDGDRPGRRRGHRRLPRDRRAGRRRAGDGRRDVRRTRRPGPTSPACATTSGTGSSSPKPARSPAARPARAGSPRPATIVDAVVAAVAGRPVRAPGSGGPATRRRASRATRDLEGRHIVITAGGTAEPIDPVRFIGNRSTGKMGVALAEAALDRGARVTLVVGHDQRRRCRRADGCSSSAPRRPPRWAAPSGPRSPARTR